MAPTSSLEEGKTDFSVNCIGNWNNIQREIQEIERGVKLCYKKLNFEILSYISILYPTLVKFLENRWNKVADDFPSYQKSGQPATLNYENYSKIKLFTFTVRGALCNCITESLVLSVFNLSSRKPETFGHGNFEIELL